MTPPLTPIEAAEKLEAMARYLEATPGQSDWTRRDLTDAASLLRQMSGALEEIAGRTPDGTHSLDRQLAPDAVRINEIARSALTPSHPGETP